MHFDYPFTNDQAQSGAGGYSRSYSFGLKKPVKKMVQGFPGHTNAMIHHAHDKILIVGFRFHHDLAPFRRIFDGIFHQISNNLPYPDLIYVYRR